MIHVPRRSDIVPREVLDKAASLTREVARARERGSEHDALVLARKNRLWVLENFRAPLRELFHGKCAYCESPITEGSGEVERFRPGKTYWWLVYDWENLLLSCRPCNAVKGNRFPIAGQPAKPFARGDDLLVENPLLLDPCIDRPEDHLLFKATGEVQGLSDRGSATIDVLNLNRQELGIARQRASAGPLLLLLQPDWAEIVPQYVDDTAKYAGAVRQVLRPYIDKTAKASPSVSSTPAVQEVQSTTRPTSAKELREAEKRTSKLKEAQRSYSIESASKADQELYKRSYKRIERIEFHNFRNFESLHLDMPQITADYETWLMVLGENGLGKTSILQGLALALMGQARANSLRINAARCVREAKGVTRGYVKVTITGIGDITLSFDKKSPHFTIEPREPKIPLLGYGATRLLPRQLGTVASQDRHIRVLNLFVPTFPLSDANQWLLQQWREARRPKKHWGKEPPAPAFQETNDAFRNLIPEKGELKESNGEIVFSTPHRECKLSELSAGYEAMLALIVDIAIGTSGQWKSIREAEGLVLLDEIEAHLHPEWRMTVVEGLRKAFPRMAFIATTHDPLCLKGLDAGEITVLQRDENGSVIAQTHMPSVHDLAADEILTSELFGLPSARNQASPVAIARLSALLAKQPRTQAEENELEKLRSRISAQFSAALTPMQQEVEIAVTGTLKKMHTRPLPEDTVAEIRRQVLDLERAQEGTGRQVGGSETAQAEIDEGTVKRAWEEFTRGVDQEKEQVRTARQVQSPKKGQARAE